MIPTTSLVLPNVVSMQIPVSDWPSVLLLTTGVLLVLWVVWTEERRRRSDARARDLDRELGSTKAKLESAYRVVTEANEVLSTMVLEKERRARWLEEARTKADEASRAKSGFLAMVSHELRTPLNSVIGFANQLRRNSGGRLDEREIEFADKISRNGFHLLGVIDRILDISALEAGALELDPREVCLSTLIGETVEEFGALAAESDVEVVTEVPEELHLTVVDPSRLQQVITQLLDNAVKFADGKQVTVAVRTEPDGRPRAVEVIDQGAGIPADRLGRIFDAFDQSGDVSTRRHEGLGLGLTLAKRLCDHMGHGLVVESRPGVGSTFRIVFPTGPRASDERGANPRPASAAEGKRKRA